MKNPLEPLSTQSMALYGGTFILAVALIATALSTQIKTTINDLAFANETQSASVFKGKISKKCPYETDVVQACTVANYLKERGLDQDQMKEVLEASKVDAALVEKCPATKIIGQCSVDSAYQMLDAGFTGTNIFSMLLKGSSTPSEIRRATPTEILEKIRERVAAHTTLGDASLKSTLNNLRAQAELYYDNNNSSYTNVCTSKEFDKSLMSLKSISSRKVETTCNSSATAYAVQASMNDTMYYCVDSTGVAKNTTVRLGNATMCK
jgi:hypothetical protein